MLKDNIAMVLGRDISEAFSGFNGLRTTTGNAQTHFDELHGGNGLDKIFGLHSAKAVGY